MKVFLDMVGCRLNQSEIEGFALQFRQAGHTLVPEARLADLVVINTCTVTNAADADSRQKIRQAATSGAAQVVVTGCFATLNPQRVEQLPGVTRLVANQDKDQLVPLVLNLSPETIDSSLIGRMPVPGARMRTRAFIKVQDGCDNHCTYCITRLARGAGKSRSIDAVLQDVNSALDGGCQEIVLTGVHLGSWGADFAESSHLYELVKAILHYTVTPRLHLSSIEPWDISTNFFDLWSDARLCRHLHLPLQSGSSSTLKRMGRKMTPSGYANLLSTARQAIPGVSITTDIITGFPGETEQEFEDSLAFVNEMKFSGGHVFTFSPRPGTPAFNMPGQVNPSIARLRNARMRQIFHQGSHAFEQAHLGRTLSVLWEKASPGEGYLYNLSGLSDNYLRIRAVSLTPCHNQIMLVCVTAMGQAGLVGEILPK